MAFNGYLKQSTSVTILVGPFVDSTDGNTDETGLTITQADVRLSKNGGNMAQKNDATGCTHDELGYYTCPLDATDTDTLGNLTIAIHESGALTIRHDYIILPAMIYDSLIAGTDRLDTNVTHVGDTLQTANDNGADINAILTDTNSLNDTKIPQTLNLTASGNIGIDWANVENPSTAVDLSGTDIQLADTVTDVTNQVDADMTAISGDSTAADNLELDYDGTGYNKSNSTIGTCTTNTDMRGTDGANTTTPPTAVQNRTEMDNNSTQLSAIVTDTNEIQGKLPTNNIMGSSDKDDHDTDIDSILVDTGTTIPNQITALNDITVADIIAGISDGTYDLQEMIRIIVAAVAGKTNTNGTVFRDISDTKNRITATLDANNNRTGVVLDGS